MALDSCESDVWLSLEGHYGHGIFFGGIGKSFKTKGKAQLTQGQFCTDKILFFDLLFQALLG